MDEKSLANEGSKASKTICGMKRLCIDKQFFQANEIIQTFSDLECCLQKYK